MTNTRLVCMTSKLFWSLSLMSCIHGCFCSDCINILSTPLRPNFPAMDVIFSGQNFVLHFSMPGSPFPFLLSLQQLKFQFDIYLDKITGHLWAVSPLQTTSDLSIVKGLQNETLPKAQRTRGLSSSWQSNFWGHITSSNTNLDHISSSESRLSIN